MAVIGVTFFFTLVVLCSVDSRLAAVLLCVFAVGFVVGVMARDVRKRAVIPAAGLAAMAACVLFLTAQELTYKPALELAGENLTVKARVADLPKEKHGKFYYTLKAEEIGGKRTDAKLWFSSKTPLGAEPCDVVEFTGTVYVRGGNSPDSMSRYRSTSIYLGAYTFGEVTVEPGDRTPYFYLLRLREIIVGTVRSYLPGEEGALVTALLLGDTSGISDGAYKSFVEAGVCHLFSVSGQHMTVWAMSVFYLLQKLRVRRRLAAVVTSAFVVFLSALTGFSPSCMRAAIMILVLLLGHVVSKNADQLNSLGFAMLLICLFDPLGAADIGLVLSFLAALGMILMSEHIRRGLMRLVPPKSARLKSAAGGVFGGVAVSLSAALFMLPVSVMYFEGMSFSAPLTNLLVAQVSSVCMIVGGLITPLAFLGPLSFLSNTAALVSGLSAKYMIWISGKLAGIPFSYVGLYEEYINIWIACTLIIAAFGLILFWQRPRKLLFIASLCLAALMAGTVSFEAVNRNTSKITALSVGNGSAVLVTKHKRAALIGCGGDFFAGGTVCRELDRLRVESLEMLLIPRAAQTESNAVAEVMEKHTAKAVFAAEKSEETALLEARYAVTYADAFSGEVWEGFSVSCADLNGASAVYLDIDGTTALLLFSPGTDIGSLPPLWLNADILYCRAAVPESIEGEKYGLTVISSPSVKGAMLAEEINLLGGVAYATSVRGNVTIRTSGDGMIRVD